ncbi:MAG: hypothetical protein ACR2KK_03820 [Acidimicrobiales bacterium]
MPSADDVINVARTQVGYVEGGGPDGRSGHVTKYWDELEGNTSADDTGSQTNGGGCCARTRHLTEVSDFYRPDVFGADDPDPLRAQGR